jgi:hypothetical protein
VIGVRIARHALKAAASARPDGYVDDVLANATSTDDLYVYLSREAYDALAAKYRPHGNVPQHGPGTELKSLLASVGITATTNCTCNQRAKYMDQMGADWCETNLGTIVGWLREEAGKRGLPFFDGVGRVLVRRAIARARKDAARGGSPLHAER